MSSTPKVVPPKEKEHVTTAGQPGIFEVVFVNTLMQTANIAADRRHGARSA